MAVTLASECGGLELLHATDVVAEKVAQLEFALGQGPSFDARVTGLPTMAADLNGRVSAYRWPLFATEAVHAGIRAVHVYPLRFPARAIGTVGLYSRTPHRLTSTQHHQAEDIAGLIGLALVDPDAGEAVGSALRMTVHQAAGMVMQQLGISIHEALVLLRSTAFAEDIPVTDLAAEVIARRRRFGEELTVDD